VFWKEGEAGDDDDDDDDSYGDGVLVGGTVSEFVAGGLKPNQVRVGVATATLWQGSELYRCVWTICRSTRSRSLQ
jgi:hypothetical protein